MSKLAIWCIMLVVVIGGGGQPQAAARITKTARL